MVKTKNDLLTITRIFFTKRLLLITVVFLFFFQGFPEETESGIKNPDSLPGTSANRDLFLNKVRLYASLHGELVHSGSASTNGLELTKVIERTGDPFFFKLSILLSNHAAEPFSTSPADHLILSVGPLGGQTGNEVQGSPPDSSPEVEPVAMLDGDVVNYMADSKTDTAIPWSKPQLHWSGLQDRYFALLIMPGGEKSAGGSLPFTHTVMKFNRTGSDGTVTSSGSPVLNFTIPVTSIAPGQQNRWKFLIFSGPKSQDALTSGPVNLNSLLFSGLWSWMRWICFGLLYLLTMIHFVIPGWGLSIIILALLVRLGLYPLSKLTMSSQQRFVDAQKLMLPELREIKKNYKGGDQSERILQLYKKHQVSPVAGLKPLGIVLIQLPILIALFHVLGATYELRDAGFLWIGSLAEPDHLFSFGFNIPLLGSYFNILPVLMSVFTLLSFKLVPAPTAEKKEQGMQNLFLIAMTLMFFFLFYSFPSGLVLYWTFANIFHIVQYRIMVRVRNA